MAAALVLGLSPAGAPAPPHQQNLTLPDVAVTAPSVPPPSAKPNPYFGNSRVEENKWPEIPCTASRIALATAIPVKRDQLSKPSKRGCPRLAPAIQLQYCHDLVINNLGILTIEADVMVFDPYYVSAIGHQRQDCYVHAGYTNLREDFPDMNQMTRQGSGWRNFVEAVT